MEKMCLIWSLVLLHIIHITLEYDCLCNDDVAYNIHAEPNEKSSLAGVSYSGDCFFYNGTYLTDNKTFYKTDIKGKPGWFWILEEYTNPYITNCTNPIRDRPEVANCLILMMGVDLYRKPTKSEENNLHRLEACRRTSDCPKTTSSDAIVVGNTSWYKVTFQNESGYVLADDPNLIRWHCNIEETGTSIMEIWKIMLIAFACFIIIVVPTILLILYKRNIFVLKIPWVTPQLEPFTENIAVVYDVFLSYSREDWKWVKNTLFQYLSSEGFSVCVDFKDFVPGNEISENILISIYKSRKTIVVLSKHFLNSVWGHFELQQSHFKAIAQRKDTLIILKLDTCKVPRKLMGKIFLDWTCNTDKTFFWKRLYRAIGKPIDAT